MKKKSIVFSCVMSPPIMLTFLSGLIAPSSLIFIIMTIILISRAVSLGIKKQRVFDKLNKVLIIIALSALLFAVLAICFTAERRNYYVLGYSILSILFIVNVWVIYSIYNFKTKLFRNIICVVLLIFFTFTIFKYFQIINNESKESNDSQNKWASSYYDSSFGGCGSQSIW